MRILRKIERFQNCYFGRLIKGIKHYNWYSREYSWLADFMLTHFSLEECQKFSPVSVYGSPRTFWFHRQEHKIFYTAENHDRWTKYRHNGLPYADLCLGFDYLDAPNYLRFPYWIVALFSNTYTAQAIKQKVDTINTALTDKTNFCALICRKDETGIRTQIYQSIDNIDSISCAGNFKHNDDRLWREFHQNKNAYLQSFKFNICPENSNRKGYVTEKLFEAFQAGAIPIYWGSNNQPEPGLINPQSILFWDPQNDNAELLETVRRLHQSPELYHKFQRQERILPATVNYVEERYAQLEQFLRQLLKNM